MKDAYKTELDRCTENLTATIESIKTAVIHKLDAKLTDHKLDLLDKAELEINDSKDAVKLVASMTKAKKPRTGPPRSAALVT